MAVVVSGGSGCCYGYGGLVSLRSRRKGLDFARRPKRCARRGSWENSRVAATMSLEGVSALHDIASQVPSSFYFVAAEEVADGPIELPPELLDPLAIPEASPLQVAASVVLTGLITVLLFRAIRRRSRRARETKFRSSGAAELDTEAAAELDTKAAARKAAAALLRTAPEVNTPPPNALQTLSGAAVAGVIALVLYKFTTVVDAGFSGKPVSLNYSIRNLTITIRTIVTGICYLATFVFAANSIGLTLLSLQLALNLGAPEESKPNPDDANLDPPDDSSSSSSDSSS